jgi:hypothetical protein
MKTFVPFVLLLALTTGSWAQKPQAEQGPLVVCDTSEEVVHYLAVMKRSRDGPAALAEVNAESPVTSLGKACGTAYTAYYKGETVDRVLNEENGVFEITRILVIGEFDEDSHKIRMVTPTALFTAFYINAPGV